MPLFMRCMEIAGEREVSGLIDEYPGLYRFVRLLERMAAGLRSSTS